MPAGARTWSLHETLLGPAALPPPPLRHALLAFLLTLAAVIHLGTAGWSEIHNGIEGEYAGGARRLVQVDNSSAPDGAPLLQWLTVGSLRAFGFSAFAARLPIALASIGSIALTFLIGERLSGYWRGFVAGLLQLCSFGTFLFGRSLAPQSLFSFFLEAAIFCAICGYAHRGLRWRWFAGVWSFTALAVLTRGMSAIIYVAAIVVTPALFFREARMRFRGLLRWQYLCAFAAFVAIVLVRWRGGLFAVPLSTEQTTVGRALFSLFVALFPACALIAPALIFTWRRVVRPNEFEFGDAVLLCWLAVALVLFLFSGARDEYDYIPLWPAFALFASSIWERSSQRARLIGIGCVAVAYTAAAFAAHSGVLVPFLFHVASPEPTLDSVVGYGVFAAALAGTIAAGYFLRHGREQLALALVSLTMLPLGLSAAETLVRLGPHFSFAQAARLIAPALGERGEVLVATTPAAASSLSFYLDRQPFFIDHTPDEKRANTRHLRSNDAVERFAAGHPVYLIVRKDQIGVWQERLTARYHLYHQISTCGDYAIVVNQP